MQTKADPTYVLAPCYLDTVAAVGHPDAARAGCHAAIYATYERTSMARGSGAAAAGLIPGQLSP